MKKDYYKILGVEKNASSDDIKKAFRKLAGQHHPDRGGDEVKFKELNEAYQILSNGQKRAEYDTYGQTFGGGNSRGFSAGGGPNSGFDFSGFGGFGQNDGFSGVNIYLESIFGDFFGRGNRRTRRGKDISIDVEIPFEDSAFGASRTVVVTKQSSCIACKGSGATPGTKTINCNKCGGKGTMKEARGTFFGTVTVEALCKECSGTGKRPESACKACSGSGVARRNEEINIDIPPGIEDGEMIRLAGMGEYVGNATPGDMYIKIHVRKHSIFRREGSDIHMDLPVKITDALLGATYKVPSLEGEEISLTVPEGTTHGTMLRVKERGIVMSKGRRGSIVVNVLINMPNKLSKQAKDLITKLRQEGL